MNFFLLWMVAILKFLVYITSSQTESRELRKWFLSKEQKLSTNSSGGLGIMFGEDLRIWQVTFLTISTYKFVNSLFPG